MTPEEALVRLNGECGYTRRACDQIVNDAYAKGSSDNLTCMLVTLGEGRPATPECEEQARAGARRIMEMSELP